MENEPKIDPQEVLDGIVEWVTIESPSHDGRAVNVVVDKVESQFRDLCLTLERTPGVDARARASWCWRISIPCIPSA